jgi:50S ribosomal protein L16 3-hydroxylase
MDSPLENAADQSVMADPIDLASPTPLLAGLTPKAFMRRHWQRKPLLIRRAWPEVVPPLDRAALFALAAQEGVESRLVVRSEAKSWRVRQGPVPRSALPPVSRAGWTLLVQGVDLHVPAARQLLDRFRFVPDARLDDVMVSWASLGGGVGPHVDSYDVFLLQVQGRRRWRVAPPGDRAFVPGLPLKVLSRFAPEYDWVLEPGDMLYLPPGWGHEGEAVGGDCMTCSVGFRAPSDVELVREVLQRLLDAHDDRHDESLAGTVPIPKLYSDPQQPATLTPAQVPEKLLHFTLAAVVQSLLASDNIGRALGELLSEPKPHVWFDPPAQTLRSQSAAARLDAGVALHVRSRMLYDKHNLFLNGESFSVSGRDGNWLRRLADRRHLLAREVQRLSPQARAELEQWWDAGWIRSISE